MAMVKEAKTLINESFINEYKELNINPPIIKKYINEIKSVIKFNEEIIELDKELEEKTITDGTIYSLILRLRELYLIDCLANKKSYSKENFLKFIDNEGLYRAYLRIKNGLSPKDNNPLTESLKLIEKSMIIIKKWEKRKK